MDLYNKHFFRLIRHVDPGGMLNVPINVFADKNCLGRYFRTNNDYRKLDVPRMCDQLIIILENFDDIVTHSSTIQFLQNDFQRIKYPFVLISAAFIGLIIIHQNALKAYFCHCKNSTTTLYKNKIIIDKIPKKRNRKKANSTNQLYQEVQEVIQNREIELLNQNQAIISSFEPNLNETDNILNRPRLTTHITENNLSEIIVLNQTVPNIPIPHNQSNLLYLVNEGVSNCINRRSDLEQFQVNIQPIEEFPVSDKNLLIENPPLPQNESEHLMNIDVAQPINLEQHQLINQPNHTIHLLDQRIQPDQLIEQPINATNIQDQHNQLISNDSSQSTVPNLPLKRKISIEAVKRNYKKRPIEKSSKAINNRLRKLEGELFDRPLEIMAMKYIQNPMNHLPLRYAIYRNKLHTPFAALTLNMELEKIKNQDDIFNNEIDMNSYKVITEKLNNSNTSRICIYQQCMNNSLPHLGLIPLAEEFLTKNSLVWRDTINEINRKLEDSMEELSPIAKINLTKWEEFKEKMKQRVQQSLVAQKTLIGPEISCIDKLQPDIVFPSFNQIEELLNGKTVNEQQHNFTEMPRNDTMDNICVISSMPIVETGLPTLLSPDKVSYNIQENDVMNQCEQVQMQSFQNIVKPVDVICHKQPIDSMKLISNILLQSPENTSCLKFTDLCPIHVTNRKNAILVLIDLLGLHTRGLVKLSQPCNIKEPSSISIEIL